MDLRSSQLLILLHFKYQYAQTNYNTYVGPQC